MEMEIWVVFAIIGSVIIPLILFILALRPFIQDTARLAVHDVGGDVRELRGKLDGLESSLRPLQELSRWAQLRGLDELLRRQAGEAHSSLPPQQAARRDYLMQRGRIGRLTVAEADELQNLLEEDARDDLARGVISFAAFVLIVLGIAAIIRGLSRE